MKKIEMNKLNKQLLTTSFIIYLLFLIWAILLKFTYPYLITSHYKYLDLTFLERLNKAIEFYNYDYAYLNIIGNIILFIPLGLYLPLILKKSNPIKCILLSMLLSITFEVVELFTRLGAIDLIDILCNMLGAILGLIIFYILKQVVKDIVINYIQLIVIVIFIPVLIYALVSFIINFDLYKPFFDYKTYPFIFK